MTAASSQTRGARTSSEVRAIAALGLPALRAAWQARWGEPPKDRSRDLLARAMAHRGQVEDSYCQALCPETRGRADHQGALPRLPRPEDQLDIRPRQLLLQRSGTPTVKPT